MKQSIKKAAVALLLILVCAGSVVGSYAYFTSRQTATNTFVVGNVSISLTEPAWNTEEKHEVKPEGDSVYEKNPTVTNTGSNAAYVRVKLQFTTTGVTHDGELFDSLIGTDEGLWTITGSGDSWEFLLKEALEPGESAVLFTQAQMPAYSVPEAARAKAGGFDISITAEAIQAYGFASADEAFAAFDAA